METHYSSYYEYPMPIEIFVDYFENHLKGNDNLHTLISATSISKRIDDFVDLSEEEQLKSTIIWGLQSEINKLKSSYGFRQGEEGKKRLDTKYACALSIRRMRSIEKHQFLIKEYVSGPRFGNTYTMHEYNNRYKRVPTEVFDKLRVEIDATHADLEKIKRMDLEDDFKNNVLPHLINELSKYYWIMGLDYTPLQQKVEDKSVSCVGNILLRLIPLIIIIALAKACAG